MNRKPVTKNRKNTKKASTKKGGGENKTPKLIHKSTIHRNNVVQTDGNNAENPVISPLSGSEPKYQPHLWNNYPEIRKTHNCYAYSLSKRTTKMSSKAQPGYFANYPGLTESDYNCPTFYDRMKKDNPSIKATTFNKRCDKGSYKIFLALDKKREDRDYHYYVQNSRGLWSHKPGANPVTDKDAKGNYIRNPMEADRNYKWFQYTEPCGFYCVNPKMARTYSRNITRRVYDLT